MFSIHSLPSKDLNEKDLNQSGMETDLMEIVNQMKNFNINDSKQVRGLYLKKGMRMFFELNEHLNAYRAPFEK